jgi:hypothetical protein
LWYDRNTGGAILNKLTNFWRARTPDKRLLKSLCLSTRLYECSNSMAAERVFMKFVIGKFCLNLLTICVLVEVWRQKRPFCVKSYIRFCAPKWLDWTVPHPYKCCVGNPQTGRISRLLRKVRGHIMGNAMRFFPKLFNIHFQNKWKPFFTVRDYIVRYPVLLTLLLWDNVFQLYKLPSVCFMRTMLVWCRDTSKSLSYGTKQWSSLKLGGFLVTRTS